MASFALRRKAITLFKHDLAPKSTARHNAKQWLRCIEILGDKWLLVQKVQPIPQGI